MKNRLKPDASRAYAGNGTPKVKKTEAEERQLLKEEEEKAQASKVNVLKKDANKAKLSQ